MGRQITDYLLYRWRYIVGYGVIAIIFVLMLVVAGVFAPGGLSQAEMQSVVTSSALGFSLSSFDAGMVVNLPYHLLQRVSIELLGVTPLSVKLPSLLLGLFSGVGLLLLLRTWFRHNVAIITAIVAITTGQFLLVAQSGSPGISYIFWSIWLLLAAMMVSRKAAWSGLWKILLFGTAALSLYTPLSIYILLALGSAALLHPHLRFLVRRLSGVKLGLATFCALVVLAPLGYAIYRHPSIAWTLLGIPDAWPDFKANALQLLDQYFDFISPSNGMLMTPVYGLGSMALIALGIYRLATTKYTARSYIVTAWVVLLVPIMLVNPSLIAITFVPSVLLLAMGVSILLSSWYRLFPRNPYARIAGLIPLAVLIGGMVFSGVDRYMYGYLYDPGITGNFSSDLRLLNHQLDGSKTTLVVNGSELAFYSVVAHHNKNVTAVPVPAAVQTDRVIVSHAARPQFTTELPLATIITSSTAHEADRFYIYKTDQE